MYIENFKFPTTFAFPLGSNLKIPAKHLGAVSYISFTKKKLLLLQIINARYLLRELAGKKRTTRYPNAIRWNS